MLPAADSNGNSSAFRTVFPLQWDSHLRLTARFWLLITTLQLWMRLRGFVQQPSSLLLLIHKHLSRKPWSHLTVCFVKPFIYMFFWSILKDNFPWKATKRKPDFSPAVHLLWLQYMCWLLSTLCLSLWMKSSKTRSAFVQSAYVMPLKSVVINVIMKWRNQRTSNKP